MGDIKLKKTQSMKSVRSVKSMKSAFEYNADEKPMDLDVFITTACKKFPCPCRIVVKKDIQTDESAKIMKQESSVKYKRISVAPPFAKQVVTPDSETEKSKDTDSRTSEDDNSIIITALYDTVNRLVEIVLNKIKVPRILMQILALIVPHYSQLAKITIKKCRISAHIIYDMNKFLSLTTITDICLDDSPVSEANYVLLLEQQSKLMSLSLRRCKIDDEVCKQIATKLHFSEPAEATLSTLNLSSNHITDLGAKHLGEALRTNRHLRYLNLADNRIGDEGANHIFRALMCFPLTYYEIMAKRRRYMEYLRARHAVYLKYLTQCDSRSLDDISMIGKKSKRATATSLKSKAKKDKIKSSATVDDFAHARAEMMADEIIGPFVDPFITSFTKLVAGYSHCIGNTVLCYLNLCYNDLSFLSLKKLQSILLYQSVNKKPNQTGLMRVLVEGNRLPITCNEMDRISEMLHRNVVNFSGKYVADKRKRKISMIPERNVK